MGEIVAALATVHAPQLFTFPPDEDQAQLNASVAAMREAGKILDETKPDVILFLGSDHLETFSIGCVPTFAMIAGSRAIADTLKRNLNLPIHREMAEDLLKKLVSSDFDMAYSEDAVLGHAFAVPFEYVLGGRDIPIVPVHVNVYMPPLPSLRRCAALGHEIARIVAGRSERVAIVASGGMSHYPGTWKYPHPEFAFDEWLISELERGKVESLLELTTAQLDEVGNTELLPWAIMLGVIGAVPGELLQYTPTWHHGHAVMRFLPQRQRAKPLPPAPPQYQFKHQEFEFYAHTPASAYKINKMLFAVRTDGALRRRLISDLDGVSAEWGLSIEEREAAQAIATVGEANRISDNVPQLLKVGVHPLQALMSLHAVHREMKQLQEELRSE